MTDAAPAFKLLLEPSDLEPHLGDKNLLILDVSSSATYARAHLPGAIHIDPSRLVCGIKPAVGKLPSQQQLDALFSSVGLTPQQQVVVYDDEGGGWAGRLIWTLDVIGHSRYAYLNGGIHAWANEGHPIEQSPNTATPSTVQVTIHPEPIAEAEDILQSLGDPSTVIWDARSREEYLGQKVVAARAGHIPGAVNLDWLDLMNRSQNLRLRDLEELRNTLNTLGITADKNVITHCQTHHRSGLSYLVAKLLGYPNIKGYHGSWSEWGNREDTPVEV